jgi:hypothetical protein
MPDRIDRATIAAAHDRQNCGVARRRRSTHKAMGRFLFVRKHEHALEYLNRAIRLNPNPATAHGYLAAAHGMGNSAAARRGRDGDPHEPAGSAACSPARASALSTSA